MILSSKKNLLILLSVTTDLLAVPTESTSMLRGGHLQQQQRHLEAYMKTGNKSSSPSFESVSHEVCENFAVHARTTVTFDGVVTTIHGGDVGVSPGTSITGACEFNGGEVVDESAVFAASVLAAHAAAMAIRGDGHAMAIELGGVTFTPGTYRSGSAINFAYGTVVTLDGLNEVNPVFLFQALSTLVTAADTSFILKNGAKAENVLWALGTAATLGANSVLEGSILAGTAITFGTQSILHGCALAQSAVTFESEGYIEPKATITEQNAAVTPAPQAAATLAPQAAVTRTPVAAVTPTPVAVVTSPPQAASTPAPQAALAPSGSPTTESPSTAPSMVPSFSPTFLPTDAPSMKPTNRPSMGPSHGPTMVPTTLRPSAAPSVARSDSPSEYLTRTRAPSSSPSGAPSTETPSASLSIIPSNSPSLSPSHVASMMQSNKPSLRPSNSPTMTPTTTRPSAAPSPAPTLQATEVMFDSRDGEVGAEGEEDTDNRSLQSSNRILVGSMAGLVTLVVSGFFYQYRKHDMEQMHQQASA